MSNIFDALQRSEGEQTGSDSSRPARATDLLKRAERRAASKWETTAQPQQLTVIGAPEVEEPGHPILATAAAEPGEDSADFFAQIQTLRTSPAPENRLICLTDSESAAAEAFRLLGVRLRDLRQHRPLKRLLVTSTVPREGKSTVAANLACTLALRMEQKTLLIDGDLRRPALSPIFGLGANPGLCEYLRDDLPLSASIYRLEDPKLWIIPAGSAPSNALDLLQTAKLPELLDRLTSWFDWVIIDSPPVLPMADTSVWTRLTEGILLVARQGITEKRQLRRGVEALESNKLVGALLNSSHHSAHSDYYYYYRSPKESKTGKHS